MQSDNRILTSQVDKSENYELDPTDLGMIKHLSDKLGKSSKSA